MKKVISFLLSCFIIVNATAQTNTANVADTTEKLQVVEASCGECQFGLKGKSCDLAVRINGRAYFVDGTGIDDHGDAHAKDGFCEAIRKAEVKGKVVKGRFKASYFKLLPEDKKTN
ncbi:MAG: DUF6370 family protein [Ferruginibacter sp.]